MKSTFLISVAAAAIIAGATLLPSVSEAQTPPMSGGYTNVISIPIDEPLPIDGRTTKAIAGALIKPEGTGPFPAIVYLGGCAPIGSPHEADLEKALIEHNRAKGFATLIVDSYTPRHADHGMCDMTADHRWWMDRDEDALAAWKALAAIPDIDARQIFMQGYSTGATAALHAVDPTYAPSGEAKIAGVVAFYPFCGYLSSFAAPTLILVGDKDEFMPTGLCQSQIGKPNVEVVVFPGPAHGFATPGADYTLGEVHSVYDEQAAKDAQARADAFIAAHMKAGSGG